MPVVENNVTIDAPVAKVFEFMDDPGNTSKWFAGVTEQTAPGTLQTARRTRRPRPALGHSPGTRDDPYQPRKTA